MRQIIPFKKELLFKTRISEITSISLEHTLSLKKNDLISGEFHVSGDYKMTEGSINREKFYFKLPFEIDLDASYNKDSICIDIDNFYYEVVNDDSLQVNIDVYVDGEKIEVVDDNVIGDIDKSEDFFELKDEVDDRSYMEKENLEVRDSVDVDIEKDVSSVEESELEIEYEKNIDYHNVVSDNSDFSKEIFDDIENSSVNVEKKEIVNNVINNIDNLNIFDSDIFSEDTYATYYVYVVKDDDNIDKIIEKFSTTKEDISNYNDMDNIKCGTKLIIPSKNE